MAASLEARRPLLDHKLVEYVLDWSRSRLHGLTTKWIFKKTMGASLPGRISIAPRKDQHPIKLWLRRELRS